MHSYFKDEHGFIFEKKHRKACYLDRITTIPAVMHPVTDAERDAFLQARDSMWKCVSDNILLAYKVAHRLKIVDIDVYVHDIGIKVLIKCWKGYDPLFGAFSTYAYTALYREFIRHRATLTKTRLDACPESIIYRIVEHTDTAVIQYILDSLSHYDRMLVEMYYWQGMSLSEIADDLCMCKGTVRNHLAKAVEACKNLAQQYDGSHEALS